MVSITIFIKDPFAYERYNEELRVLKSKIHDKQAIVVVLDSHFLPLQHRINGIRKNDLDEFALSYFDVANSDTNILALVGYFWPNAFESANALVARRIPASFQEQYTKIGKLITGK